MDQKSLKTSPKQRIFISIIAIVMLGSIIASYAAIVISGNSSSASSSDSEGVSNAVLLAYENEYSEASEKLASVTTDYFNEFIQYKSRVTAYNETAANSDGLAVYDLKEGTGRELTEGDNDYLAFYIGWCADEEVFDTTFDDPDDPTSFKGVFDLSYDDPIMGSSSPIEGWSLGVQGMKLGGIRELTIPGELAYGDSYEICGGYSSPLKFIIMAVENSGEVGDAAEAFSLAKTKLSLAYNYNIDYADLVSTDETETAAESAEEVTE